MVRPICLAILAVAKAVEIVKDLERRGAQELALLLKAVKADLVDKLRFRFLMTGVSTLWHC
jgi:hypothetical protein